MKRLIRETMATLLLCAAGLAVAAATERSESNPTVQPYAAQNVDTKLFYVGIDLSDVEGLASKNAEILRTVFGPKYVPKPRAEVVLSVDRTKRPAEVSVQRPGFETSPLWTLGPPRT